MNRLPNIGDRVSVCGGTNNGIVLDITEDKVLVMEMTGDASCPVQYIIGHCPQFSNGELAWYHGRYFLCNKNAENLVNAAKCYAEE